MNDFIKCILATICTAVGCKKCAHFYNLYDIMAIVGGNNGKICI